MKHSIKLFLIILGLTLGPIATLTVACYLLITHEMAPGVPFLLILASAYGWVVFAFFHYRHGRQEEFLSLLTTAIESETPLAPTLWTYLRDRPTGGGREIWVGLMMFFMLPGYYWFWHKRHTFDHKIMRVTQMLEAGAPLLDALKSAPGVVSRATLLGVAIGQSTGKMAPALRHAAKPRLSVVWLEIAFRIIYSVLLLIVMFAIMQFWMMYIFPRLQRIFTDFQMRLPAVTENIELVWYITQQVAAWAIFNATIICFILYFGSHVRWYTPVVGRIYRIHVQSMVLRMLGTLLEAGKPVPEALTLLERSTYFSWVVRRRLSACRKQVEHGGPLGESLYSQGLLSQAMVPLLQAAERVRNVPWAIIQLGDNLAGRAGRILQKISLALSPVTVFVVGGLVAFFVLGMFLPIIKLTEGLSR